MFIVPNQAGIAGDFYSISSSDKKLEQLNIMRKMNGLGPIRTDKTPMIQLWIVSKEDLHTENFGDHGGTFLNEGGEGIY